MGRKRESGTDSPVAFSAQAPLAGVARRVVIWGVGLMGGSLGLALRQAGAAQVIGLGRRPAPLERALTLGAVNHWTLDPAAALAEPCLLVLGMPVATMAELAPIWGPRLAPGTVVTDLGSTKARVVAAWEPHVASGSTFVGGHPMCGSEKTSVEFARPDLYRGARWILTPTPGAPAGAVAQVQWLAETAGAHTLTMPPDQHDRRVAYISHLQQAVAVAAAAAAQAGEDRLGQVLALAAGGFRDTTRVAESSPEVWHEIFFTNQEPVLAALADFRRVLVEVETAIATGDAEAITRWFGIAAAARNTAFSRHRT